MGSSIDYGYDRAEDYRRLCEKYGEQPDGSHLNITSRHFKWLEAREEGRTTSDFEDFCGNIRRSEN